jgi:hypothetical protein
MKRWLLLVCVCVFCAGRGFLAAQQSTPDEIETLLQTGAVTWAQAARFVLEAADIRSGDGAVISDPDKAFRYAADCGWLPKKASAGGAARLDGLSLLFMRSFRIKGGLLFSITKAAHYAYRELVYKNIIQGRADPAMNVSGERLLFITNRILSMRGEQ